MAEKVIGFKIQIEGLAGTIETATELKRQIAEVNKELKKASNVDDIKKLEKQLIDLKAAQSLVNDVTREQVKLRKEEISANDKAEGAYRRLSKQLNDQRNRYKDLAAAEQDSSQEAKDLLVSINNLDKKLKGIDATVGQFQRNVGGYTEALSNFFPRLGGTIGNVTGLVGDLSSGFAQLGKTTGVANVGLGAVGLALTAFSGISAIIDDISQSARAIFDLKLQLENFGVASENLDQVAVRAQTIGEIFKVSADEVAVAANTLVKEFGVPFEKAFDTIQSGFLKGANAQGEFLKELKEYPAQFKAANIGLEEFLALSIDSAKSGIYDDKALDAVKEFGLSVREQLKGTRDAFVAAFGEEFTDNLFNNLNTGAITTGEALKLVTKEVQNTGVSGKELQGLISTVFRAAGEDAGEYVLTLGDVLNNTDNLFVAETDLQKQLERNIKVTQDLNEETAKYSQTVIDAEISRKEFLNGLKSIGLFITDTFIGILNAVGKSFSELFGINEEYVKRVKAAQDRASEEDFQRLVKQGVLKARETKKQGEEILKVGSEAWKKKEIQEEKQREIDANKLAKANQLLKESYLQTEDGIQKELDAKKKKRKTIAFGTPEFKKVESEIKQLEKELEKFNPSKAGSKGGEKFVKSFTDGSLAALEDERSKLQTAFSNAVVGSGTQKELAVKLNAINVQIKDAVEQQNQILADAARGNLLKNLQEAQQLATLPLKVEPLKSVKASDLAKKEKEDLKKVQDEIIKNSADAAKKQKEINDQQLKDKQENTQKLIESVSNSIIYVTDIIATFQKARAEKEAEAINEQITNTEKNIEELEAKAEKASGIRKKRIERDIASQRELLKQQQVEAEAIRIKAAKEEKRIAIIQAIIQGALAVQRALASVPFPANLLAAIPTGIAAAAQVATISAQPLAEGGVITGERVNQRQNIPTRSNGDNVLAFVKRGEVVLNQRQQSLLGGSPTFRKIGIKGFAQGGLVPPISAPIQGISMTNDLSKYLDTIEAKTDAINNRIDRLQAYVVSEDIARDLAEGNKLKVKATL